MVLFTPCALPCFFNVCVSFTVRPCMFANTTALLLCNALPSCLTLSSLNCRNFAIDFHETKKWLFKATDRVYTKSTLFDLKRHFFGIPMQRLLWIFPYFGPQKAAVCGTILSIKQVDFFVKLCIKKPRYNFFRSEE